LAGAAVAGPSVGALVADGGSLFGAKKLEKKSGSNTIGSGGIGLLHPTYGISMAVQVVSQPVYGELASVVQAVLQPVYGVFSLVVQAGTVQPAYGVLTAVQVASQPMYGVSAAVQA
jgi:hypothetical protein